MVIVALTPLRRFGDCNRDARSSILRWFILNALVIAVLVFSGGQARAEAFNYTLFDQQSRVDRRGEDDFGGKGGTRIAIARGQTFAVQFNGTCYNVTNGSAQQVYFPTTSLGEAQQFVDNGPAGVPGLTVSPCTYRGGNWLDEATCSAECGGGTKPQVLECMKSIGFAVGGDECSAGCGLGVQCQRTVACNTQACETPAVPAAAAGDCWVWASGTWLTGSSIEIHWPFFTTIRSGPAAVGMTGDQTDYRQFADEAHAGSYPSTAAVFPNAAEFALDGLALSPGAHIVFYREPNFQGGVLKDLRGPLIVNNNLPSLRQSFLEAMGSLPDAWLTGLWYDNSTESPDHWAEIFPPSTRRWTEPGENMQTWIADYVNEPHYHASMHDTSARISCE